MRSDAALGAGLLAAVYLAGATPGFAQSSSDQLPTLTVEAPAIQKKKKRIARPRANAPSNNAGSTASSAPAEPPATQGPGTAPANANPYANPGAPWKVERSASTKLTEPLVNTPRTVNIIPKEVIADKGATTMVELVRTTAGLTLGTGEGGNAFGDRVFIRGFDARNDMYIDGIRESGVATRETFMTEQVEIVKGPSGSISGRGTTGGAINIVTKKPAEKNFYNFDLVGGTDATRRLTADINHQVTNDFAVRFNAMGQQADVAGRDLVYDNRYGISGAAAWKPTDSLKISLDYYHLSLDQLPDWGVPFDPRTRMPFTEAGLRRANYYGIPARDFQKGQQDLGTASLEYKISPDTTLSSKTRYGQTITDYIATKPEGVNLSNTDPTLWTVSARPVSRYQVNETIANQTDITTKLDFLGARHTLVTGTEISRENISQDGYSGLNIECGSGICSGSGTSLNVGLWNPNTQTILATGVPTLNYTPTLTKVDTRSIYILDTINWSDRLILNFGARIDHYDIMRKPFSSATAFGRSDTLFNWNAGIVYKPVPIASVYAAYSTSSNPVGSELDAGADAYGGLTAANSVFRPEENTSIEIGTKWELFNKYMLLSFALFQTEKDHARETTGGGASAVITDSAAYRVRGIEVGLTCNITPRLSLYGGLVLMHSEVLESISAANVGRPLANIAHESFNILAKYKLTDHLTIGAQATYKGEILGGTLAAVYYSASTVNVGGVSVATPAGYNKLPDGWRFDLMAEYEINKTYSAKVQVLNVFDKVLYDGFYRNNTPYVYIAPGRVAYVTLKVKFD